LAVEVDDYQEVLTMAVLFYEEGEHLAGFIGYRVATTLGEESEFRQRYFGLSEYSPAQAHNLAESIDRKWRTDAEAVKRVKGLRQGRPKGRPGVLAMGFRVAFRLSGVARLTMQPISLPVLLLPTPDMAKGRNGF